MKNLTEYLTESAKKYVYRVKIAGDLPEGFYDKFKMSLGAYDVEECTKPTQTPIQSDPLGFPELKNESVNMFDVTLNYPANSAQIVELARIHGITPANIVVIDKAFNDSMNAEVEGVEDVDSLLDADYPETTKTQKKAKDEYADSYKKAAAQFAGESNTEFEIAGGKTPAAKYSTDKDSKGDKSPFSNVKRQAVKDMGR